MTRSLRLDAPILTPRPGSTESKTWENQRKPEASARDSSTSQSGHKPVKPPTLPLSPIPERTTSRGARSWRKAGMKVKLEKLAMSAHKTRCAGLWLRAVTSPLRVRLRSVNFEMLARGEIIERCSPAFLMTRHGRLTGQSPPISVALGPAGPGVEAGVIGLPAPVISPPSVLCERRIGAPWKRKRRFVESRCGRLISSTSRPA